ncbi:MAG: HAMP domain-containing histidine kinase, partial [Bacteroidales bacterium]|nr:HAMP domain-containing histidine kinase [Bacteroidales bacterium]
MNRNKFIWLILMMVVSILGIIGVQMVWIINAVGIRNESFNNAVADRLSDAANSIESSQKMSFFNDFLFDDPLLFGNNMGEVNSYVSIGTYSSGDGSNFNVRISDNSFSGTIDSNGVVQINRSTNVSEDTTVYLERKEFADWFRKRISEFRNMSDRMISEVYQWEKTLELDKKQVAYILQQSFLFSGITTPFEFALIRNGIVEEGTFKRSTKNDFLKSNYKIRLFPDNILRQDLVLSVVFPERTNFILGSMAWILGGSLLFSFMMLATFALSLFFIIRQKKISEMKSDFINNMTHEFKTPIATISLAADTITNSRVIKDENSIRHFVRMIKKENDRMNKKVETILQIASLDKKEIDFKFENVSLHSVIERSVEIYDIQVQQKNGRINLMFEAEEPVIYGDNEHLTNLVNNLVDNAIKYSPESPDITIRTKNNGSGIIMSVEDKG